MPSYAELPPWQDLQSITALESDSDYDYFILKVGSEHYQVAVCGEEGRSIHIVAPASAIDWGWGRTATAVCAVASVDDPGVELSEEITICLVAVSRSRLQLLRGPASFALRLRVEGKG